MPEGQSGTQPMAGPASSPPTPEERESRETKVKSALWSAVWEASQYMELTEIEQFVSGTLHEIRSDEP